MTWINWVVQWWVWLIPVCAWLNTFLIRWQISTKRELSKEAHPSSSSSSSSLPYTPPLFMSPTFFPSSSLSPSPFLFQLFTLWIWPHACSKTPYFCFFFCLVTPLLVLLSDYILSQTPQLHRSFSQLSQHHEAGDETLAGYISVTIIKGPAFVLFNQR